MLFFLINAQEKRNSKVSDYYYFVFIQRLGPILNATLLFD